MLTSVKCYSTFIQDALNFHECMQKLDGELKIKKYKRCGKLHVKSLDENCWICEAEVIEEEIK